MGNDAKSVWVRQRQRSGVPTTTRPLEVELVKRQRPDGGGMSAKFEAEAVRRRQEQVQPSRRKVLSGPQRLQAHGQLLRQSRSVRAAQHALLGGALRKLGGDPRRRMQAFSGHKPLDIAHHWPRQTDATEDVLTACLEGFLKVPGRPRRQRCPVVRRPYREVWGALLELNQAGGLGVQDGTSGESKRCVRVQG